jgi:acyl-CoA thioesterase I
MILQPMMKIRTQIVVAILTGVAFACAPSERSADRSETSPPAISSTPSAAEPAASPSGAASPKGVGRVLSDPAWPRIVFLGDSLTAGLGLEPDQSIPSLIQAQLQEAGYKYNVVNAGVSGDTSAGGLRRLNWSLEGEGATAGRVEVLVIELGANDGLRGLPIADMKRNLDEIVTTAKRRGITVVLTGMEAPPNYGAAYTSEFRQVFSDLAREHRVIFVPFFLEGVAGNPALNQRDGIHPNPEGARIVERTLWKALEPLLEKD